MFSSWLLLKIGDARVTSPGGTSTILGRLKGTAEVLSICKSKVRDLELAGDGRKLIAWIMFCGYSNISDNVSNIACVHRLTLRHIQNPIQAIMKLPTAAKTGTYAGKSPGRAKSGV